MAGLKLSNPKAEPNIHSYCVKPADVPRCLLLFLPETSWGAVLGPVQKRPGSVEQGERGVEVSEAKFGDLGDYCGN